MAVTERRGRSRCCITALSDRAGWVKEESKKATQGGKTWVFRLRPPTVRPLARSPDVAPSAAQRLLPQHASHRFESLQNVETSLVHLELQCRFVMRAVAHLEDVERAPHLGLELEVSE